MINFDFDNNCSGCGACFNVCPVGAIKIVSNQEGFKVPLVDNNKCIGCKLCDNVCPYLKNEKSEYSKIDDSWLYSSPNENAKMKSSSGAAFFELANKAMAKDWYVCGCVWNNNLVAEHIVDNTFQSLERMQGSKYVQSDTKYIYKDILHLLKAEKKVLFSGTPCQCTAASNYVKAVGGDALRNNLITIAVICHGVASPLAWESFKKWISEKEHSKIVGVNFRDKSKEGYKKSYCMYAFEDGHSTYIHTYLPSSKYIEATLVYNLAIRNSCSHCDCKGHNENIDIILGDWYKEYKNEGELGTSCIVAYTDTGKKFLNDNLTGLRKIDYSEILQENRFIEESEKLGVKRDEFLKSIKNYEYWSKVEKLYPAKYPIKKFLVKIGLYDLVKGKRRAK